MYLDTDFVVSLRKCALENDANDRSLSYGRGVNRHVEQAKLITHKSRESIDELNLDEEGLCVSVEDIAGANRHTCYSRVSDMAFGAA